MISSATSTSRADAASAPPVPPSVADRLLAEILGRPAAHAALGELCDRVGGRTAGGASGTAGEEWALGHLRAWGLPVVRTESLPVEGWERGSLIAEVRLPTPWTMTALAHGFCPTSADVTAPVLDLGHGEAEAYEAADEAVGGALVLCDEGASEGRRMMHRTEKLALAIERGAAGLMILSNAHGALPRTGTCHRGEAPIPSLGISQEDGLRLRRLIADGVRPEARIAMRNRIVRGEARNVIAEIPGRERPEEFVLAGGHLDSWDVAQGATDNGLGSAIVLEAARALNAVGRRPRRTLRFVLWAAEEIGLLGSHDYAARHADSLDDHVAVMNFDMTGAPYGYWTPGRPQRHPVLAALARQLAPLGMGEDHGHKASLHSDHQPFMLAGVPVVGLLARLVPEGGRYYHSVGDTFEKVSLPDFCAASAVAAHTLWALAEAEERPWQRLDPEGVKAMVAAADLVEALAVDGHGPVSWGHAPRVA